MSGYPDATLGRVQNEGYSNAQQALSALRNDINEGVRNQIAIMQQWKEREENNKQAQTQREWSEAQAKLDREFKSAENDLDRDQRYALNTENNLYADARNDKQIQAQKSMNYLNNQTARFNRNADFNQAMSMMDLALKDKKGKIIYDDTGKVVPNIAKANAMGINLGGQALPTTRE